jgi:hypothetical protein
MPFNRWCPDREQAPSGTDIVQAALASVAGTTRLHGLPKGFRQPRELHSLLQLVAEQFSELALPPHRFAAGLLL